jgi:small subunit ribosomal protein S6
MPTSTYEGMFVLDSAKASANWDESVQQVHGILGKHNAEIVASRHWDERRFAYPIGRQKKGTFLLTYFKAEGGSIKDIEDDCRLSDLVLRDLILKVHPKLVDHLIESAMSSTPSVENEERSSEDEFDDRPRRRRRDE